MWRERSLRRSLYVRAQRWSFQHCLRRIGQAHSRIGTTRGIMESDCKTHDGDVGLGKHAKGSAKSRPVEEATLQMQHRFRTDRAGLSKSMGCIGKPSLAATLTR